MHSYRNSIDMSALLQSTLCYSLFVWAFVNLSACACGFLSCCGCFFLCPVYIYKNGSDHAVVASLKLYEEGEVEHIKPSGCGARCYSLNGV